MKNISHLIIEFFNMNDEYVQLLTNVLLRVTSARSTAEVKNATEELQKNWYKNKETVVALIRILQTHEQPQIRQLSGVEVRKLIPKFWYGSDAQLDTDTMEMIKTSLLRDSLKEENDLVRHTVARIISAIASIDLDEQRWPALLPELSRAAQSGDARERETATYVLYALLDSADYCSAAAENPAALFQLLGHTIDDPESLATRVNSVQALSGLSAGLSGPEASALQPFIPKIVTVLRQCVDASDDKSAIQIFENLSELIDADSNLLGNAFSELLAHMLADYGLNSQVEPEIRVAALRVVSTAVTFRYKRINRLKLGPELTTKLVEVVATVDENDDDEDEEDDDDDVTPQQMALQTLETLANRLPPSQVIAPLLHLLPTLVNTPNPHHHRAAYLAFSATADGAPEFVSSETSTLLPWIVGGLKSDNAQVRLAALQALVQLGEISGDAIGEAHATLVPLVYGMLDSAPSLKVCRFACFALGTLLRTISNEIVSKDYLPGLVPRLLDVIHSNGNLELKGFVISTIGTAAEVTGQNYTPYFEQTIQVLEPYVAIPDPSVELDAPSAKLVSEALGTLARLCCAVGAEKFAPYLEAWMKTTLICLHSEDMNLRELAPLYISDIAEVYGAQFGPYVGHIIPHLFKVLEQEEITFEDINEDDMDADLGDGLKVNSALCMEKEFSLDCLGALWKYVPADPYMMPFFADSLSQFKLQVDHFYDEVRLSAITGLWRIFQSLPTNDEAKTAVWEATSDLFETEIDVNVMSQISQIISEAAEQMGAQVFPNSEAVELVLKNIYEIVLKTHRVFEEYEDEDEANNDEEPGEESSEATTQLIQTALELLTRTASVLSAEFAPMFPKVAEMLQPYATSQVDSERASGVGTFADLIGALKVHISPYTEGLLSAFTAALSDSADGVRSVAAYGVGLLAEFSSSADMVKHSYGTLFPLLGQVLSSTTDDRTIANGAGAVARLAAKYPDALPVSQSDALTLVLRYLPLKDAYEEYSAILPWLATLQLPAEAKPIIEKLWEQHTEAQAKDAVKSVNYLPADDPLGEEAVMNAWNTIRQKF